MSQFQFTVPRPIDFTGVGLHSGELVNIEVRPALANTGIVFQRVDTNNGQPVKAHPSNISSTQLCTTIGTGGSKVSTIEHLMAAFYGLGIDNALVLVDAEEIPILDGSAAPFVDRLNEVGVQIQKEKRKILSLKAPVEFVDGDQFIRFTPDEGQTLTISCTIDFDRSKAIGKQFLKIILNHKNFMELCEARTFCHLKDVEYMRSVGLALGGSLDNAIVVDDEKILNNDGLRYPDEFVRHKILDCLGDLALVGVRFLGHLELHKPGHTLHAHFTKKVLQLLEAEV